MSGQGAGRWTLGPEHPDYGFTIETPRPIKRRRAAEPRFTYERLAHQSARPHGLDHDCFMCADARADIGAPPLVSELEIIARRMAVRAIARGEWEGWL